MQLLVHPVADVQNVQSCTYLANSGITGPSSNAMASGNLSTQWQVQGAPYSWPVTSSIIGPHGGACIWLAKDDPTNGGGDSI